MTDSRLETKIVNTNKSGGAARLIPPCVLYSFLIPPFLLVAGPLKVTQGHGQSRRYTHVCLQLQDFFSSLSEGVCVCFQATLRAR